MLGVREILSKSDVMPLGESTNEALVVKHTVQKKIHGSRVDFTDSSIHTISLPIQ